MSEITLKPEPSELALAALAVAESKVGVHEVPRNSNKGKEVEMFLKSVGLGKGYAWCAAFVYWCFGQAAGNFKIENPLPKTGGVLDHNNKAKAAGVKRLLDTEKVLVQPGDIFIMQFAGGRGHTGIVESVDLKNKRVFCVEGNTNEQGSREGDGVYKKYRNLSSIYAFIRY